MSNPFFDHPILNSPYARPQRHWELDADGQPTQQILEVRRRAEFITPIPKPKKRKGATADQQQIVFDEGQGLSSAAQQYDPTSVVNELRQLVNQWRDLPNPAQWQVTPETTRLLQHWRHHEFTGVRPFFCQIEAVETAIWVSEVAPQSRAGKRILDHLANANRDANPQLMRLALKLPRLFSRRQRSVQRVEDNTEGGNRSRRLGDAEQRYVAPVRQAEKRSHCREGHQSPWR